MASSITSLVLRRTLRRALSPICSPRLYSSAVSSPLLSKNLTAQTLAKALPAVSARFASSSAVAGARGTGADAKLRRTDENLLRVLDSEIQCAEDPENGSIQDAVLPKDSPFEIIDNPGDQTIILKREFYGENIKVTVFSNFADEEGQAEDEDSDENEDTDASQQQISLVVTINKGDGPILEFCCNLEKDEIEIESLAIKSSEDAGDEGAYLGPDFSDLDEGLQKSFHKYLSARGVNGSLRDFLPDYMIAKEEKEYIYWLKNLKEFVSK